MKILDEIKTFCRRIKNEDPAPVYLLMGEEPYFIDRLSQFLENVLLPESDKAFNQHILWGDTATAESVMEVAKQFPIGAQRQLVSVHEAQGMDKSIDRLEKYCLNPQPSTVLVICYKGKNLDKRKALYKAIQAKGVVFESPKLYQNQVPEWIASVVGAKKLTISPASAQLLTGNMGNDLSRIANEIDKLAVALSPGAEITPEVIERNVGISKDFNNFEYQKALGERDALKAFQIADYLADSKDNHPIATVSLLYGFFTKLAAYHVLENKERSAVASQLGINPFFLSDYQRAATHYNLKQAVRAIEVLREIDLKAKGVDSGNMSVADIYKELTFKILNL